MKVTVIMLIIKCHVINKEDLHYADPEPMKQIIHRS